MMLGLLVSAAVLFRVGLTDTLRALTFGGRVMGVVFLAGALVETVAAAAVFDYWGDSREVLSEDEQQPYGMKTRSTAVDQPVALLRRAPEQP
ncbi:hypothetical protein [Streptomyces sp. NPDC056401]|uniref:hypothetical protein n=1 Tax=Streptomyces sp. NPDC056401 TaxID=3345809 RepID=UPI0035E3291B